jgi:hypothetical protein
MNILQNTQDLWNRLIKVAVFLARVPAVLLMISGAAMVSFLLFLTMYRLVTWIYLRYLAQPWM